MRTDVKIGIAIGLFVMILAVIYFVVTGEPSDQNQYQAGLTNKDRKEADKTKAKPEPWEEGLRVRENGGGRKETDGGGIIRPRLGDPADSPGEKTPPKPWETDDDTDPLKDSGIVDPVEDPLKDTGDGGLIDPTEDPLDDPELAKAEQGGFVEDTSDALKDTGLLDPAVDSQDDDDDSGSIRPRMGEEEDTTKATATPEGEAKTYTVQKGDNGFWV
ncbi:MAG: hypothetical protein ACLFV7_03605, partial [Phycisphaerae bacterium]